MNIFYLHHDPKRCARYHVNRHCNKMIIETCQLLCSAIFLVSGIQPPYKLTHPNHPSAIWTRKSKENWKWLHSLGLALCEEYTYRYGKIHATEAVLKDLKCPDELSDEPFTQPTQAMPDQYKDEDSIIAYRKYYCFDPKKKSLHTQKNGHAWKNRKVPYFINKVYPEYEKMGSA